MKTWEKVIYAGCILVGAALFQIWFFAVFIQDVSGGFSTVATWVLCGLGSLLFWVPFLDAPLPGTVPLRTKWYGWVLFAGMVILLFIAARGYNL